MELISRKEATKSKSVVYLILSSLLICWLPLSSASDINPARPDELIKKAEVENTKCRGGPGDDPNTPVACYEREKTMSKIQKLGWCWGPRESYGYQKNGYFAVATAILQSPIPSRHRDWTLAGALSDQVCSS